MDCIQPVTPPLYAWVILLFLLSMAAWGLLSFTRLLGSLRIHTNNQGIQFHTGDCYGFAHCIKEA